MQVQHSYNSSTNGLILLTHVLTHSDTEERTQVQQVCSLCPDYSKEDPVVYGVEFGVVFLVKGPRTAFGLYHSGLDVS